MSPESTDSPLALAWPFWVLGLTPVASHGEIEKACTRLLNALTLQVPGSAEYMTPAGSAVRDEFRIREARSLLMDPARRALAEFWYVDPAVRDGEAPTPAGRSGERGIDWKRLLRTP